MAKQREFRQAQVWRWLKRNPGASSTQLAEAMGLTGQSASHVLQRMKHSGHARIIYPGDKRAMKLARWEAIGDKPPTSFWGTAPGSIEGLKVGWENWETAIVMANQALGRAYRRTAKSTPKVRDGHALSQLWMMPMSGSCEPD